jgi:hypothetical protein
MGCGASKPRNPDVTEHAGAVYAKQVKQWNIPPNVALKINSYINRELLHSKSRGLA